MASDMNARTLASHVPVITDDGFLSIARCPDCSWSSGEHNRDYVFRLATEHHQDRGVDRDVARPNPTGWKAGLITDGFNEVAAWSDGQVTVYATIDAGTPKGARGRPVGLQLTRADAVALRQHLDDALRAPLEAPPIHFRGPIWLSHYHRNEPVAATSGTPAVGVLDVASEVRDG